MTETERFMVDDAGSLIDKQTCKCYDYMEEILPLLNSQEELIKEYEHIFYEILRQTTTEITDRHFRITVDVSPKMYMRLSDVLKGKR